jgi:transporter family protein
MTGNWQAWAAGSALFAALTAIFGKIGVAQIDSNLATLIRTIFIVGVLAAIVAFTHGWQPLGTIPKRTWIFLLLSGLATGASWLCYYHALKLGPASGVAPIDKLSVVLVALFGVTLLGERLSWQGWLGILMMAGGAALVSVKA